MTEATRTQWDSLNTGQIRSGTTEAWNDLNSLARDANTSNQASSNAALLRLLGRNPDGTDNPDWEVLLDIDNYIDYLILNFYGSNWIGRSKLLRGSATRARRARALSCTPGTPRRSSTTVKDRLCRPIAPASATVPPSSTMLFWQMTNSVSMFADHVQRHFSEGGVFYVDPNSLNGIQLILNA